MTQNFTPEEFIARLSNGDFDGQLRDEISRLTDDELELVALIIARRIREASAG
jgi:hypothetical protein